MGFWSEVAKVVSAPAKVVEKVVSGAGKAVEQVVNKAGDVVNKVVNKAGDAINNLGNSIDDAVRDVIPGGWTTVAEVAMAFTPLGPMGSAGIGALSGATNKGKGGFNLQGAIMGGLQGYGVGSLTNSLASAGAPNPYGSGANYDLTSTTGPEAFNPASADVGYVQPSDLSMTSATPINQAGIGPVDYSLASSPLPATGVPPAAGGLNPFATAGRTAASSEIGAELASAGGLSPTASAPGMFQSPGPGQYPTGGELGVNAEFTPAKIAPPSSLETLGSGMADKASQAGQGLQNLVGAGPQGLSGIGPAASTINAGMSTTAYSGLGLLAMQTLAEKQAEKLRNQQQYDSGAITNEEYVKNEARINESIASAEAAVARSRYESEPDQATQQEALYPRKQRTLYEEYGVQNPQPQEVLYSQDNEPQSLLYAQNEGLQTLYATGGSVDSYETPDTMMAGGITNAFNFNSGGQMPMYAMGGDVSECGVGSYAYGGEIPRYAGGGWFSQAANQAKDEIIDIVRRVKAPTEPLPKAAETPKAVETPTAPANTPRVKMAKFESAPESEDYLGPLLYSQRRSESGYSGLGGYAQGGEARFLSGGGDGMSDSIKARIDDRQEARLADGEFVIPADVVSHLGNGSSKAGAKQLHAMMNRIRKARTGNPKQGKQINPLKLMPA